MDAGADDVGARHIRTAEATVLRLRFASSSHQCSNDDMSIEPTVPSGAGTGLGAGCTASKPPDETTAIEHAIRVELILERAHHRESSRLRPEHIGTLLHR